MTALDVSMGRELADLITGQTFTVEVDAVYARDAEIKLSEITQPGIYVDGTVEHKRIARDIWGRDVTLKVVAARPQQQAGIQGEADAETEKDEWLSFVDGELIEFIKGSKVGGKLPNRIQFNQRLDPAKMREQSLFFTQFTITYLLA